MGSSRFGRMRGRPGGGGPTFERSGTIRVVATAEGKMEKIEITIKTSGSFGERDFSTTSKSIIELSDLGKIKVEVPEEAMAEFVL